MTQKVNQTSGSSPYAEKRWLKHYDYFVPAELSFPRQSIYQALNLTAAQYADRPATAFLGANLTFAELKIESDKLATALSRLGIGKGDRVGIMLPNCPQYLISFFAVTRLGAIVANVNPLYTAREVELIASDSGMRAMIVLDMLAPVVNGIIRQTKIEYVISTNLLSYSANPQTAPAAPHGDGAPVVLVPGFMGNDYYLYEMYFWLKRIGYHPYMSNIGVNADCLNLLIGKLSFGRSASRTIRIATSRSRGRTSALSSTPPSIIWSLLTSRQSKNMIAFAVYQHQVYRLEIMLKTNYSP